jgi:hypothetical protein
MQVNPVLFPTLVLAASFFWVGWHLQRTLRSRRDHLLLLLLAALWCLPGLTYVLYYTHLFDNWTWFYNFRAIPYTELAGSGTGLLAGLLYRYMEPETPGEKAFVPAILTIVVFIPFTKSLLTPVDLSRLPDHCTGEVCLQSSPSTCCPSSAATLLLHFGHAASVSDLAREAFTSSSGTENWYLARAMLKRGIQSRAVVRKVSDASDILAPSIAGVVLPGGAGHFIAVLENRPDQMVIVDPLKGKQVISPEEVTRRFHFTGFFLTVVPQA